MAHSDDEPNDWVDPHLHGACCQACGFSAELEKSGVPPPAPGKPLVFPLDEKGAPIGAVVVLRHAGAPRDNEVVDVTTREVRIGRVAGNEVVIPQAVISRRQSVLVFTPEGVVLSDLRSGCGTFVNGKRIGSPQVVREGDKIYVGDTTLELVRIPT